VQHTALRQRQKYADMQRDYIIRVISGKNIILECCPSTLTGDLNIFYFRIILIPDKAVAVKKRVINRVAC
jgi:hypothetical protein